MATISKQKAQELLDAYTKQQTAATEAAIAAYNEKQDAAAAETQAENREKQAAAAEAATAAYDKHLVQQLADEYRLAEQIANLGLNRSGTADAARSAVQRTRAVADAAARATHRQAVADLQQSLLTARRRTESNKASYAASARKTLQGKLAEKKLSLTKMTL